MKYYRTLAFLISIAATGVLSESYYSIIAPGTIKSNRKYSVAVTLHGGASQPSAMQVSIEGPAYNESQQLDIGAGETKQLNFMPAKLEKGRYFLKAEGLKGIQFKNQSILNVDPEGGPKIYVQKDRAIYKPMDMVRFRVAILDEHTRPLNISEPVRVDILDANSNRVKQFKDIKLIRGVYTGNFQLSEHPAIGSWQIVVIISGRYAYTRDSRFTVKKYVLPKFNVNLEAPDFLTPSDKAIKLLIYGKYTFDKYVEGNVTVTLSDAHSNTELDKQEISVATIGSVEFKLDDSEKYKDIETFYLFITMAEKQTGIEQFATTLIERHKQHYNVLILVNDIEFRNKRPYRLKAKVQHWNGSPVLDTATPIVLEHGEHSYETTLNAEGVADFEFEHDGLSGYRVKYKDSEQILPSIYGDYDDDDDESFVNLKLKEKRPRLGKTLEIEVTAESNIPDFVYVITSHANVVHMEYVKLPGNKKSHIIRIEPSIEMIPRSVLYVHYVQNGNLRYKEMLLDFPFEFENQVTVTAPKQVAPRSEVTLNIKAQPNSYVCLLAVDLSVYLLDPSYDLNGRHILDDLLVDATYSPVKSLEYPGLLSGLITLTNAHYPFKETQTGVYPSSSGSIGPEPRTKFPETWIFQNLEITKENTQLTLTIPDTITTWRITAFSINPLSGFGIVDGPTDIVSILPFFLNLNLPYSVKRGEILSLPITVFNYHNQSVDAEIAMYNNGREFEFAPEGATKVPMKRDSSNPKILAKNVTIPSNGVESVNFLIKPKQVGDITLNVSAVTALTSDAVIQKLKVEPAGAAQTENKAMLLKISATDPTNTVTLKADIPQDIVPESEHLSVAIGGDTLAPTMENLDTLAMRPTGCGEQNMVNFAPNILVLQYLKSVGKMRKERKLVSRAMRYIEIGYQQELSFRHSSGGYSAFGETVDKGEASTWLTAYVTRFFMKAAKFFPVEERAISSGLDYLAKQQLESGEFPFTGYLFYPAQQNRFGMTAFVLMTFLEEKKYLNKYKSVIEKALDFLDENLDTVEDIYALSIMAVALQMAEKDKAKMVLDKLQTKSMEENGHRWWSKNDKNTEKDVEITSYIMMALLETNEDVIPVLKWLTEQRNANGGFKSTHDTVVGLQALVKYSQKFNDPMGLNFNLRYAAMDELGQELQSGEFVLDANNSLILQTNMLPSSTRAITFNASGTGQSMLQLSSQYYVDIAEPMQHFQIEAMAKLIAASTLNLDICFVYQPADAATTKKQKFQKHKEDAVYSNMVILEVNLPTGYRSDAEFSYELLDNELVQRIESKNSDSLIVIYLDNLLANNKNCLLIEGDKTHDAMNLKASPVVMYDYYNSTRKNTMFYTVSE